MLLVPNFSKSQSADTLVCDNGGFEALLGGIRKMFKGNKGGQSRAGYSSKRAHEGGQMPIQRRIPKRGFTNINRVEYKVFNLGHVDQLVEKYNLTEFSLESLYINGLIAQFDNVKLLATGELKSKLSFKVNAASAKAKAAVEAAGGTLEIVK